MDLTAAEKLIYNLMANDRKLTHGSFARAGYSHIVSMQACFTRQYTDDLAELIANKYNPTLSETLLRLEAAV